jgi:hypothetical protein
MALIVAPSSAGKSWMAQMMGDPRLVDGDVMIRDTVGWLPGRWWDHPATRLEQQHRNKSALIRYLDEHPSAVVLFNGNIDMWYDLVTCVYLPPEFTHRENAVRRREEDPTVQPSDWDELTSNTDRLKRAADKYDIPIVNSWFRALAMAGLFTGRG